MKDMSGLSTRLTVIVIGGLGKVRRFRISPKILFGGFLFFGIFIILSVIVINLYFEELRENRALLGHLREFQEDIKGTKVEVYSSKQRLALLEDQIHKLESEREGTRNRSLSSQKTAPEGDFLETPPPARTEKEGRKPCVDVRNLTLRKKGARLTVNFRLVNISQDKGAVSGYVHVIAMNKSSDPPQLLSYPKVALRDGLPINYKGGQVFNIRRFRNIQGKYFLNSEHEWPSLLKVVVYGTAGNLMLEKEFDVKSLS